MAVDDVAARIEASKEFASILGGLVVPSRSHQWTEDGSKITPEHLCGHERLIGSVAVEQVWQQHDVADVR